MSIPILPLAEWPEGINQASIPANDNANRLGVLNGQVISKAVTAQPGSPTDGDTYIIAATHTGAMWAAFSTDDLVIYRGGTWHAFAPIDGVVVNFSGHQEQFLGSSGWTSIGGGSFSNPMTTAQDLIKATAGGAPVRLGVGSNGQVLSVTAGAVGWATPSAGFANPMTTTGDVIYSSSGSTPARLGVGSSGQVLTVAAGVPSWATPSSGFVNPMTTIGDVIVGDTGGAAIRLANGTAGYVLTAQSGAPPAWAAPSGGGRIYTRGATWSGGGSAVVAPAEDVSVVCHTAGTITAATVLTDGGTGSCVVDVWKDTFANYPPAVGDSIAASAKPTVSSSNKARDTTLAGWTTSVAAGDILRFHLESTSNFTNVHIELEITP